MKNKKIFLAFTLVIFVSLVFLAVTLLNVNRMDTSQILFEKGDTNLGELSIGDNIVQEIITDDDNLKSIGVYFATFQNNNNKGKLLISVKDQEGELIADRRININEISDNSIEKIVLDKDVSSGQILKVIIDIEQLDKGTTLTCMTTNKNYTDYDLIYNGEIQQNEIGITVDYDKNAKFFVFSIVLIFMITILLLITITYLFKKKLKVEKVFLIVSIGLGIIYMYMLPVRSAPDEDAHIVTAYNISNKILGTDELTENGKIYMRYCDTKAAYKSYNYFYDINQIYSNFFMLPIEEETIMVESTYGRDVLEISPDPYIVPAIGITIGRVLGLSGELTLLLGRLLNYILYIAIVYFAIKRIPFSKNVLLFITMLPIVVQQTASYSYDSLVIALSMALVSYLCFYCVENSKLKYSDLAWLAVTCLLLCRLKSSAYLPLVLVLLIPAFRFRKNLDKKKLVYGLIGVVGLVFLYKTTSVIINMLTESGQSDSVSEYYTIPYLLESKKNTLLILFNSIWRNMDFYIFSGIGYSLSYFTINTPVFVSLGYIFILLMGTTSIEGDKKYFSGYEKIFCLCMSLISAGGISLVMLLSWTEIGQMQINGVQGRYFIPMLILLLSVCKIHTFQLKKDISKYLIVLALFLQYFTVSSVINYYIR